MAQLRYRLPVGLCMPSIRRPRHILARVASSAHLNPLRVCIVLACFQSIDEEIFTVVLLGLLQLHS